MDGHPYAVAGKKFLSSFIGRENLKRWDSLKTLKCQTDNPDQDFVKWLLKAGTESHQKTHEDANKDPLQPTPNTCGGISGQYTGGFYSNINNTVATLELLRCGEMFLEELLGVGTCGEWLSLQQALGITSHHTFISWLLDNVTSSDRGDASGADAAEGSHILHHLLTSNPPSHPFTTDGDLGSSCQYCGQTLLKPPPSQPRSSQPPPSQPPSSQPPSQTPPPSQPPPSQPPPLSSQTLPSQQPLSLQPSSSQPPSSHLPPPSQQTLSQQPPQSQPLPSSQQSSSQPQASQPQASQQRPANNNDEHHSKSSVRKRERPSRKSHVCALCGKDFYKRSDLVRHERVHTGERPYKCDVCEMAFAENHKLTAHMRTHTGDKPYECDVCRKCFTRKTDLTRHTRVHSPSTDADFCIRVNGSDQTERQT